MAYPGPVLTRRDRLRLVKARCWLDEPANGPFSHDSAFIAGSSRPKMRLAPAGAETAAHSNTRRYLK